MSVISQLLEKWTTDNSRFEETRDYISMSYAALDKEEILRNAQMGYVADHLALLKCYKGYQMEDDLKRRIIAVFGDRITLKPEMTAFDGKVQGHPDFLFDGFPADCKSVPRDEHLPVGDRLPRKVYGQMQAYMLYGKQPKALVIYESRETGSIRDYWVFANPRIQREIDEKYKWVVDQL